MELYINGNVGDIIYLSEFILDIFDVKDKIKG